jgi:riboflavin kinase/FMN adenylyltransferase
VVLDFNQKMAKKHPKEFVQEVLVGIIGAKAVVVGATTTFGRDARGTPELLERIGEEMGLKICIVPPVTYKGEVISSTLIRKVLRKGDLDAVREMLGRPFSLRATVCKGKGLGRKIGFPTANLDLKTLLRPPRGVYLTYARINGSQKNSPDLPSLTYIGPRPTFIGPGSSPVEVCEVHILDFEKNILSREMEVIFVKKLREVKKFKSALELSQQISRDVKRARNLFTKFAD